MQCRWWKWYLGSKETARWVTTRTRVGSWAKTWAPEITDIRAQFCHIHHGSHLFVIGAQNTNLLPFCKYELEISFPLVLFVDQITNIQFFVRAFNFWYIGIFMGKVGAVLTCPHRSNSIPRPHNPNVFDQLLSWGSFVSNCPIPLLLHYQPQLHFFNYLRSNSRLTNPIGNTFTRSQCASHTIPCIVHFSLFHSFSLSISQYYLKY